MKFLVSAVVVLYNPDRVKLASLLESLAGQADRVYAVDNTPDPNTRAAYQDLLLAPEVEHLVLGENKGIATAQNLGIRKALAAEASEVLLLDQDSVLPPGMVTALQSARSKLETSGIKVAAIAPSFVDQKTGEAGPAIRHAFLHVKKIRFDHATDAPVLSDYVISSGSLIQAEVLQHVGFMRDELFIDWVDIEWGLRAKRKGYLCFIVPQVVMHHSIGDESVQFGSRFINLHNDIRNFYIVRNAVYLLQDPIMGNHWRTLTAFKVPQYVLFYSWHSPKPLKSLVLLSRAIVDGMCGKMGAYRA